MTNDEEKKELNNSNTSPNKEVTLENTLNDNIDANIDDIDGIDDIGDIDDIDDILNNINNESNMIQNDFVKRNMRMEKMDGLSKEEFNNHLQSKLDKLGNRLTILQIKYQSYKSWYDKFNIMIIIVSSLLSIFEAFRNEMGDIIEGDKILEVFFSMIPIGISSFITCSAAIIKFKKYQEKMENMQFTREKVILSISKIKHIQELTKFRDEDHLYEIKKKYLDDIYSFYIESSSEIERHIKYSDHLKLNKVKLNKSDNSGSS